jgi:N-acetylneuraminic acid mutarotase
MSGSSSANAVGVYGSLGTASTSNVPGSRGGAASWTDSSGNFWLFGGVDTEGYLNDLWEFNPTAKTWTWISGSDTVNAVGVNAVGVYGTLGVAATTNVHGGRDNAVSWTDSSGNLWLFGGGGYASETTMGAFNDLWEFNSTTKEWTWMSGSSSVNAGGVYGTLGAASTTTVPGSRQSAVSWTDSSGNLWLFGGGDNAGSLLNDLWEFNPTAKTWTWRSGSSSGNPAGVYGTLGVASTTNMPGGRQSAVSWTDSSGNFWLFGGGIYEGSLNDLWEFNPTAKTWTWISGSNTKNAVGVYGTLGIASTTNVPGGRGGAVSWTDSSGNFWLSGGYGYDSTGSEYAYNDLWKFSPATKEWTWVSGSSTIPTNTKGVTGVYGTLGVAATTNVPGGRDWAVGWIDDSGNFWLFGGAGYDSTGASGELNDLWRYQP